MWKRPAPFGRRAIYLAALLFFAALTPGVAGEAAPQALRILVTNDDGFDSPGLAALVQALDGLGRVAVAAPLANRSGSSHSIALAEATTVERVEIEGAEEAFAVDGSPAGAANWGLLALGADDPFDVLVSGINRGANVGDVAHYSGTVGAAMEGLFRGVPSIAVSQDARSSDYGTAARFTARLVQELSRRGFPEGVLLSVNVPAAATTGDADVAVAPMGGSYLAFDGWQRLSEDGALSVWRPQIGLQSEAPDGTDTAAYLEGRITITPLRFDWTDAATLRELGGWISSLP